MASEPEPIAEASEPSEQADDPPDPARSQTPLTTIAAVLGDRLDRRPNEEQRAAVEGLIPEGDDFPEYLAQYVSLTVLSAAIAALGLLADSSAVVIGAMLVAPLMTPITAAAAATVTARNDRLIRALLVLALGMAVAIAVGWVSAFVAAGDVVGVGDLPAEVRARTFPQLLDLGIAIAAGAAAGYITPRSATLGALPGVGIAVALVPPLAVVGITAEAGLLIEARNALLLFLTNLAAIVFAAALVLLASGFRPSLEVGRRSLQLRILVTFVAVAAVAIPLALHTRSTLRDLDLQRAVAESVAEWDDTVRVIEIDADVIDERAVVFIVAAGSGEPRPAWQLAEAIRDRFGGDVDLEFLYEQDRRFQVSAR